MEIDLTARGRRTGGASMHEIHFSESLMNYLKKNSDE